MQRRLRIGDRIFHAEEGRGVTGTVVRTGLVDFLGTENSVHVDWDDDWNDYMKDGYRISYPPYEIVLIEGVG